MSRELEKSGGEKNDLISKIEELDLYNDSSERELTKIIKGKQNLMVDQNVLKLELKRLRDMLNERADEVFSLEKRRLQLETVSNLLRPYSRNIFSHIKIIVCNSYFSTKTYVVVPQKSRLYETVLLSAHNICFNLWVRKFFAFLNV